MMTMLRKKPAYKLWFDCNFKIKAENFTLFSNFGSLLFLTSSYYWLILVCLVSIWVLSVVSEHYDIFAIMLEWGSLKILASITQAVERINSRCYRFQTVFACINGIDKQRRPRSRSCLIRVFPVCHSDKHFVNSSLDNPNFIWEQKEMCSKF